MDLFFFFFLVPSMVFISVIIYTYYGHITNHAEPSVWAVTHCTLDISFLGIWVLLIMQFLSSVILKNHIVLTSE